MRVLVVEDDFTSRKLLCKILKELGDVEVVIDGEEALKAFVLGWQEKKPYDLICMDIMMPNVDGQESLQRIRDMEKEMGIKGSAEVKVIMITALGDPNIVIQAYYKGGATSYVVKPIRKNVIFNELKKLKLMKGDFS